MLNEPGIAEFCVPQQMALDVHLFSIRSTFISGQRVIYGGVEELLMQSSCLIFCLVMLVRIRSKPS